MNVCICGTLCGQIATAAAAKRLIINIMWLSIAAATPAAATIYLSIVVGVWCSTAFQMVRVRYTRAVGD